MHTVPLTPALALGAVALLGPVSPAQDRRAELEARVLAVAAELAEVGVPLDPSQVAIEVSPRSEAAADVIAELEGLFGVEGLETWRQLLAAAGSEPGVDSAELAARTARDILEARAVYYQPARNALVFVEDSLGGIGERDLEIAHALAVAGRDQVRELSALLVEPPTLDQRLVLRALVHGEGQAAAAAVQSLRAPAETASLSGRVLDHRVRKMGLPEFESEVWIRGRGLVQRTLASAEGRAALDALWDDAPSSTEEASYLTKLGRDRPVSPPMPEWPEKAGEAQLLHEDTLGELAIQALLSRRYPRPKAWLTAVGWDGDVIRRYETTEGKQVLVWRTAWDRPVDAQQFAAEWGMASGQTRTGGRVVDWALSKNRGLWNRWLKAFEATPGSKATARSDAKSSEALEEDFHEAKRSNPYLVGTEWRFPKYDLTVTVPVGWYENEVDGLTYFVRTKTAGFRDNFYVLASVSPDGETIEDALEVNRLRLDQDEHLDLQTAEIREVDGRKVAFLRYQDIDAAHQIVYTTQFFLSGDRQIAITAGVDQKRWDSVGKTIDAIMAAIKFGPVPPVETDG